MTFIIGIDPGYDGGICILNSIGKIVFHTPIPTVNITKTKRELDYKKIADILSWDHLYKLGAKKTPVVYLEQVASMPRQGVVSTFNFGKGYGAVIGMVSVIGYDLEYVLPQIWKKHFHITHDTRYKVKSIEKAKELFEEIHLRATSRSKKDHDGMAEAALIARYGMKMEAKK